jgi:hypothetical protein
MLFLRSISDEEKKCFKIPRNALRYIFRARAMKKNGFKNTKNALAYLPGALGTKKCFIILRNGLGYFFGETENQI